MCGGKGGQSSSSTQTLHTVKKGFWTVTLPKKNTPIPYDQNEMKSDARDKAHTCDLIRSINQMN